MKINALCGLLLGLLCCQSVLAESAYVQARQAKIHAAPSAKAEALAIAQKGDQVEIVQRDGRWLMVRFGQQQGWVSSLLIGAVPPGDKISVLADDETDLDQSARRRASAATSSAAARGLRSDERARESDAAVADFGAVRQMERMGVSESEAQQFLEPRE